MSNRSVTAESLLLRALLDSKRVELGLLLQKYGARNPQLFGSVARGTAGPGSDIDILVEMDPADGNLLMRASGLLEETRELFSGNEIDIFPIQLLKEGVSAQALKEVSPL